MNCRRCSDSRNVGHYFNDLLDGWFCIPCVDALIDFAISGDRTPLFGEADIRSTAPGGASVTGGSPDGGGDA